MSIDSNEIALLYTYIVDAEFKTSTDWIFDSRRSNIQNRYKKKNNNIMSSPVIQLLFNPKD